MILRPNVFIKHNCCIYDCQYSCFHEAFISAYARGHVFNTCCSMLNYLCCVPSRNLLSFARLHYRTWAFSPKHCWVLGSSRLLLQCKFYIFLHKDISMLLLKWCVIQSWLPKQSGPVIWMCDRNVWGASECWIKHLFYNASFFLTIILIALKPGAISFCCHVFFLGVRKHFQT